MSTHRLAWVLAAALAGPGCASGRVSTPPPPPPPSGLLPLGGPSNGRVAVSGRVDDVATGRPLAGARVVLTCSCLVLPRVVVTAEDGTYFVGDLPPGPYEVQAHYARWHVAHGFVAPAGARLGVNFQVQARPLVLEYEFTPVRDVANRSLLSDGCPHWRRAAPQCRQEYPRRVRVTHLR